MISVDYLADLETETTDANVLAAVGIAIVERLDLMVEASAREEGFGRRLAALEAEVVAIDQTVHSPDPLGPEVADLRARVEKLELLDRPGDAALPDRDSIAGRLDRIEEFEGSHRINDLTRRVGLLAHRVGKLDQLERLPRVPLSRTTEAPGPSDDPSLIDALRFRALAENLEMADVDPVGHYKTLADLADALVKQGVRETKPAP